MQSIKNNIRDGTNQRVPQSLHVIGEFIVNNIPCLAIVIEKHLKQDSIDIAIEQCFNESKYSNYSELTRFQVDGRICIIAAAKSEPEQGKDDIASMLTEREMQIAILVSKGHPNKQIGRKLNISEWTVASHLRRVFAKLNVDSRAAMVYQCSTFIHHSRTNS
ncbi:MAG: response regulator transcription factor [Synechococcus sp.]